MLVPYQRGRGFPVYQGGPPYMGMQRGRGFGSVLGSIFRNVVVPAAKNVGKSLLRTGLKKASRAMRDVADGHRVADAISNQITPRQRQPRKQPQTRRRQPTQPVRRQPVKRKQTTKGGPPRKAIKGGDVFSR